MKKIIISFITVLAISILFFIPSTFANNMVNDAGNAAQNAMNNSAGAVKNGINSIENAGNNAMNNIKDGANSAANAIGNGVNNAANTISDNYNDSKDSMDRAENNNKDNPKVNYDVRRTSTETNGGFMGFMNGNNIWAWIAVGVVVLAIIGVIWYYLATSNNHYDND